jgi:hypothetical protein
MGPIGLGAGPVAIGRLSGILRARFGEDALRCSLLATVLINMWAVFHFVQAARYVDADLGKRA